MAIFNSFLYVYQRVTHGDIPHGFQAAAHGFAMASPPRALPKACPRRADDDMASASQWAIAIVPSGYLT